MALHPIRIEGVIADPAETVRVTRWLAAPGAHVAQGQPLAVVETAKADLEVEAPRAGWLAAIHAARDAHVVIGATLGLLADAPDEKVEASASPRPTPPADAALSPVEAAPSADATPEAASRAGDLRATLARQHAPVRLVWDCRDAVIPPAHAQGAPGFVALNLLEGVGHVPPVEAPGLTARLILETARSAG